MPVFYLSDELVFPPPELAAPEGLLAIGGDLSETRLLLAYRSGIFPWYNEHDPILWWSPDPRFVLYPSKLKVSRSMRQVLRRGTFRVTFDTDFRAVITQCRQKPRPGQAGTWITQEMLDAYCHLHETGYAHSVEVWEGERIVGGLYGISLGRAFFGESMFTHVSNASKAGFITLVRCLEARHFSLIDSQVYTAHLESMGAGEIPRARYLEELQAALNHATLRGPWTEWLNEDGRDTLTPGS